MNPTDRKYTKTHEWVLIQGNEAIIGITDHAQDSLGDITFIDFPKMNSTYKKGAECGVIESVKAASDYYMPIGGTVSAINSDLSSTPETINSDPYNKGWIFKLININPADANDLMDAKQYETFLGTEV